MIVVVFALAYEARPTKKALRDVCGVEVWVLGVAGPLAGPVLAKRLASNPEKPALIISAGLSCALQSQLEVGEVFYSFTGEVKPKWAFVLDTFTSGYADIQTVTHVITSKTDKLELGQSGQNTLADMETSVIRAVCGVCDIPMLSVRGISETAEETLIIPAALLISPKSSKPDVLGLLLYLCADPRRVLSLANLATNANSARCAIARSLKGFFNEAGSADAA